MFTLKKSFYMMQPIYSENFIYGYEILSRLKCKDCYLTPESYLHSLSFEDHYLFTIKNIINLCRANLKYNANKEKLFFLNIDECLFENFFIEEVMKILIFYNMDGKNIVFEVLENKSIKNINNFITSVQIAKKYGIKIALDDFGSGFSNMDRLLKLNPDYIKIDRLFISGIEDNAKKQFILKNLFKMIKELNIKIISEGIETRLEYEYIKLLKSDYYQGYFFSKPKDVKEIMEISCTV